MESGLGAEGSKSYSGSQLRARGRREGSAARAVSGVRAPWWAAVRVRAPSRWARDAAMEIRRAGDRNRWAQGPRHQRMEGRVQPCAPECRLPGFEAVSGSPAPCDGVYHRGARGQGKPKHGGAAGWVRSQVGWEWSEALTAEGRGLLPQCLPTFNSHRFQQGFSLSSPTNQAKGGAQNGEQDTGS